MIERLRGPAQRALSPVALALVDVSPHHLTWASLAFSLVAAGLIGTAPHGAGASAPLLGASLAVAVSGLLDILDGMVARLSGRISPRGDFLDHTLDRYADAALLAGVHLSGFARPALVFMALAGVLLTSYVGVQAQAHGVPHLAGALSRAVRLVLLAVAPVATILLLDTVPGGRVPLSALGLPSGSHLTAFEVAMVWFAAAGLFTSVQRALHVWRRIPESPPPPAPHDGDGCSGP